MVPADDSGASNGTDSAQSSFVYCPECGTKASVDWSFCRSCQTSLSDVEPTDNTLIVRSDGEDLDLSEFVGEETGCPTCGHHEADVDDIAVTGNDASRLVDLQNRRFKAVSCTRCGCTEFYRGRRPEEARALFLRGRNDE
jgi:predicted nucleic-acid-binding Zn-ribbon protein